MAGRLSTYKAVSASVTQSQRASAGYQSELDGISSQISGGADYNQVDNQLLNVEAKIQNQKATLDRALWERLPDVKDATPGQIDALQNQGFATEEQLDAQLAQVQNLRRQARDNTTIASNGIFSTDPPSRNSSGQVATADDTARTQSPPASAQEIDPDEDAGPFPVVPNNTKNSATNATPTSTQNDITANQAAATEDPAIYGNEASGQATSVVGGGAPVKGTNTTQQANGAPAATSANDDSVDPKSTTVGTSASSDTRPDIPNEFTDPIIPKPNLLSGLSSVTYSFSIYLMDIPEYANLVAAQDKVLPSRQLLLQSAGVTNGDRNPWFNVDFYIEDVVIESIIGTQASGTATNAVQLSFTVVEPNGITFLNRLNNAVIEHVGKGSGNTNAFAQNYLMVLRFYGYDAAGGVVTAEGLGLDPTTDSNAIIEKFIPFMITNFKYKIATKNTEYRIEAVTQGANLAFSTERGTVPFNLQLVASDLKSLLNGNLKLAQTQVDIEDDDAGPIPENNPTSQGLKGNTVVQGLVDALNKHQRDLVKAGTYEIADEYEIEIENAVGLADATLAAPGKRDKKRANNITSDDAAARYLASKTVYDKANQSYSIQAGTQISQLLDLVLRTSSFITSQQDIYFDEKTGEVKQNSSKVKTVQWYRIRSQVTPIDYDVKRKSIAYKIKYIISRYQINTPRSPAFPPSLYRGVHKLYNYWFTGQNTEVLDFEIDANANYFTIIGNDGYIDETPDGAFPARQAYSVAPGGSLQAGTRNSSAPAANLSDRLYSIADVATAEIEIVGDPDWIQQSEVLYNRDIRLSPFMPDGSVNYDASEVLFELRFNPAQDYDLATGLTNVYENNIKQDTVTGELNIPQENLVWCATTVTSTFSQGFFKQKINGYYRDFAASVNKPNETKNARGTTNTNAAEGGTLDQLGWNQLGLDQESDFDTLIAQAEQQQTGQPVGLGKNTPASSGTPNKNLRLQSNGSRVNFNVKKEIDKGSPYRDVQENGQTVRVYGSEQNLNRYVGPQAVPPKPGSGENAVDSDAGDTVKFGGIGGYGAGNP